MLVGVFLDPRRSSTTSISVKKKNISSRGRSAQSKRGVIATRVAQSRVKIIAQCEAFDLYQEEHSQVCSSEELPEATKS